jgi:hypothetical protein
MRLSSASPNIGSAPPFSLEWAIALKQCCTNWKCCHTRLDYFLSSRTTFLIYRRRKNRLSNLLHTTHMPNVSVDIPQRRARYESLAASVASPWTAKSIKMIARTRPQYKSRVQPMQKQMRCARSFEGTYHGITRIAVSSLFRRDSGSWRRRCVGTFEWSRHASQPDSESLDYERDYPVTKET